MLSLVPRGTLSSALCLMLVRLAQRKKWDWLKKVLLAVLPVLAGESHGHELFMDLLKKVPNIWFDLLGLSQVHQVDLLGELVFHFPSSSMPVHLDTSPTLAPPTFCKIST